MNLEKLEQVKDLLKTAKQFETLTEDFAERTKPSTNVDKYNLGFGVDSRFSIFNTTVSLDGYTGNYGSSSCYVFARVNEKIAKKLFNKAINIHMDQILKTMAELGKAEAMELEIEAREELERAQKMLDDLLQLSEA